MIDPELLQSFSNKDLDRFKRRLADPDVDVNGKTEPVENEIFGETILMKIVDYLNRGREQSQEYQIVVEMLKEILKHPKLNINLIDSRRHTALMYLHSSKPEILKILLTHPKIDLNKVYTGETYLKYMISMKYIDMIKILLEDGRSDPEVGRNFYYLSPDKEEDRKIKSLLENYNYISPYARNNMRMISEVATMSGTDTSSNVQSRTLPQLPLGISTKINQFVRTTKPKPPRISEETKRYQERVAKEKEEAEQKKRENEAFIAREGILSARDSFPADADPDPTAFKGTNPRNLGGRKTKSSNTKRGGRKTRRKSSSTKIRSG